MLKLFVEMYCWAQEGLISVRRNCVQSARIICAIVFSCALIVLASPVSAQQQASRVSSSERTAFVSEIQRQLKRLDCYDGAVDGRLKRDTFRALEKLRVAVGYRQFAAYNLVSLRRRASRISETQYEAWINRLREVTVRCQTTAQSRRPVRSADRGIVNRPRAGNEHGFEAQQTQREFSRSQQATNQSARTLPQLSPDLSIGNSSERSAGATAAPSASSPTAGAVQEDVSGADPAGSGSAPPASEPRISTVPKTAPPPPAIVRAPSPTMPAPSASAPPQTRSAVPSPAAVAPSELYDVVPIFYGTDRLRD